MKRKFIITAEMRDLEQRLAKGEISYSRMIEILCEKADEYAEEYHQSELLKLNKSDVISSVSELSEMILKHKAKSEYKQASIVILRNIFEENGI